MAQRGLPQRELLPLTGYQKLRRNQLRGLKKPKRGNRVRTEGIELKERKIAFLKTAYYLDGESKRRSLRKKYERRIA